MARAIWSGSISFGMVSIPVKLHGATESKDISFHLLHSTCGTRLKQVRWCPTDEVEVPWSETVRGYEYAKDQYVTLTDEDFEKLPLPSKHVIELSAFVDEQEIDPVFYERSYYLSPDERAEKPYALLLRAIERAGRVGIGRFVLRTKPHLVAIRPASGVLGLETLFFGDEVRDGRELVRGIDGIDLSERELKLADTLISTLETTWDASAYADEYRTDLLRRIAEKEPVERPIDEEGVVASTGSGARVEELMEALRASVEAAKARKTGDPKPKAKKRASGKRSA
jgi:DNA end-binding protein Ku